MFARAAERELQQQRDDRRDYDPRDCGDRRAAPIAIVAFPSKILLECIADRRDHARDAGRDRRDEYVVVAYMRELVREHTLELALVERRQEVPCVTATPAWFGRRPVANPFA